MTRAISCSDLFSLTSESLRDGELPDGRAHVFDLRDAESFIAAHVPMARHLPPEQALRWIPQTVERYELVVLIDEDGARGGAARHLAAELVHHWFRRIRYLDGGMATWLRDKRPVEHGGPAGLTAASECGKKIGFHHSGSVPWQTSSKPLPPDPGRVVYDYPRSGSSD